MTERMKRFSEAAVKNDKTLEKLQNLKELSFAEQIEQIMVLAAEEGITLTEDDFNQFDGVELTDEELEKTAGGGVENLSLDELMTLMTMYVMQTEEEKRAAYEMAKEMQ